MVPIAALSACHERPPPTLISVLVTEIQQPCVGTARDVTPALTPTFVEKSLASRTRRGWIPVTSTGMRTGETPCHTVRPAARHTPLASRFDS
ncbi:hypothetical protein SAMN03159448_06500 [Sinorhizobium sp. NFACC03]|nr:hypothetical protein SAMN03159448_06500 [Sinorhizobium sp. NFACC03]